MQLNFKKIGSDGRRELKEDFLNNMFGQDIYLAPQRWFFGPI